MHGFIDSFPVPVHISAPTAAQLKTKGKGKEKEKPEGETYDVVANWTKEEKDQVQRKIAMASTLGYSTILLTISISATTNPAILVFPTPLLPEIDPRTAKAGTEGLVLQLWKIEVTDYSEEVIKSTGVKGFYGFSNSTAPLFPAQTSVLSVTPTSFAVFSHIALSLSPPSPFSPTYITFDPSLSPRLPFTLKRGLVNSLLRAGAVFEIILRGIIRQDDPGGIGGAGTRRRNWISGAREIVRATGGKSVVISTGAEVAGEMRAGEDIINLCSLIGLTPELAKDALTTNPQRAIQRGLALRQTYRGVISNPTLTITSTTGSNTSAPSAIAAATSAPSSSTNPATNPATKRSAANLSDVEGEKQQGKKKKKNA